MTTPRAPSNPPAFDPPVSDPARGPVGYPTADLRDLVIDLTDGSAPSRPFRGPPTCRSATRPDLERTAELHANELPDGFFVRFGPRFLAAYHRSFLAGPFAVALVVGPPGVPTGFVVGTSDNARHYHWLLRNSGPLLRSGLRALAVRPGLAYALLRTRAGRYLCGALRLLRRSWAAERSTSHGSSYGSSHGSGSRRPSRAPVVAVLTHVSVARDARGTGSGRALVDAFVQQCRDRGADEIRLITKVATPAPGFYRRLGWTSLGERTASDGTLVEEFQLVL